VLLWGLTATGGRAVVSAAPITNLLQLGRAAQAQPRLVGSVALEGTVWWSSAAAGRILLQADSSVAQLELALPDPMPQQGTRLRLEGECLVAKTRGAIKLSAIPVVDNDGLHGAAERSGSVYLPVGRHPIRVAWFNRAEHSELAVAYEGPDLPRQTIPAAVLFRAQVDRATGATNYVPGLDYRCCEGLWWSQLPNLAHLAVVSAGVVGGFDLAVRSREEQVGLQFSGSLQIAREGLYLFYTKSDDGSALFIGESSLQMKRLGPADWPPRPPGASPALAPAAEDYQWGEIEGTIGSVNRWADGLELEVVTAAGHLRVQVAEAPEGTCTLGPQNRIRAVGVCHYVRSLDGSRGLGEVYVQSWREITQRPATPGLAAAYLLVTDSNVLASPVLTLVEQVHQLSPEELQRDCPVKLRGVVTAALGPDAVVLQDTTRAIYVATTSPTAFQMGDFCEVEGIARPGEFNPYIVASRVEQLGAGLLPGAVHPTWDQLLNGSLHLQYVELEGVVTAMAGNTLTLLTHDGRIKVAVESLPVTLPATCRNALVRLRGLLFATWDRQTHRVDVGRISLNQPSMSVLRPAPDDPFALPTKNVDDLLRFDPQAGALQRVKVSGQLSYVGDEASFLRDGDKGLRFFPVAPLGERVGERVEVVGFPDLSGPSPVLQEAVVRRLGVAELPQPHKLAADSLVRDDYDATYVQVEGVLVGLTRKPEESVLDLQSGLRRFAARVQSEAGWPAFLGLGSRLALTGVYVGQGGNRVLAQPIDSFHLLVNSGHDLRVLSRPPWWTMKRSLTAVGVLAGVLLAALIWIKLLRSKVTERSRQLVGQIEQRERLERQRLVEQERARVAHDLHDDLGAGLTEVNMLTSLVKSPTTSAAEKARYLEGLNATALRMVTSLDEIVWAVNPSNDTIASLASYFAAYAQRFLELAGVACALEVAEDLPEYRLDSKFRHDVFLAFKEALNNVIRHAGATRVWLRISVPDCRLVVVVADNGRGIESGQPEAGADGLINMRERLRAMGGSCEIQSEPGQGTTVRLRAPLPRILP
jgi:signal transduction histidine kinase